MEDRPPVRLAEVAQRAGVSRATASRALRSDPRISRPTTERVRAAAEALGYVPDPVISRWAAGAWAARRSAHSGYEIAFVSELSSAEMTACFPSARERAAELGYTLRFHSLAEHGGWARLNQVIRAKNIPGVLLDKWLSSDPVELASERLAVVCCGVGHEQPYHAVRLDTFRQMELMWEQVAQRGRRRLLLWLQEGAHMLHGRLHHGAALECACRYRPQVRLAGVEFAWLPPDRFVREVLASRADCVVSLVSNQALKLRAMLEAAGWQGDWLLMRTYPGAGFSGILPHDDLVGRESVNLLDRLIRHFEIGRPANPMQVILTPHWHEEP